MEETKTGRINTYETLFRTALYLCAVLLACLPVLIFSVLVTQSLPSLKAFGFSFFYTKTWDPVAGEFGALPFLVGTILTSFLALAISIPFSLSISLFLGEYYPRGGVAGFLNSTVELLAGIPSVVYGFWGLFVLVPLVRSIEMKLGVAPYGVGILTASLILAVMIIPYSASIGREVIRLVPSDLKEAAYSLGATRFEVIKHVVLPGARSGILAGMLLSLGRALGETMAVTMVIGNSNTLPGNIFAPGNTMASIIANEFTEAVDKLYLSSLIEIGLILFIVTTVINVAGRQIIKRLAADSGSRG
ncbi:MAG: phosphate ABC transporter permease subunit PstC [Spirochaetota bacterium]